MKKILAILFSTFIILGGTFAFVNLKGNQSTADSAKIRIVTTNSILEDMVDQIVGDRAETYSIVKRGTDPHEYDPQPSDIEATTNADVIFHNGLNLETGGNGWFKKLTQIANKKENEHVFAASKTITPEHLTTNKEEVDPHAWLTIPNGIKYVSEIARVLKAKDPENASYYQDQLDKYVAKLQKLDREAKADFSKLPENQRYLVTSEGAFKYFGKEYGLKPVYIWEINTESQGTPEQMERVLTKIEKSDVKALFVESSVSPKSMDKVSKEADLPIYAKIFTDSLAKKGTKGDTYYSMMKWNIDKIREGLAL